MIDLYVVVSTKDEFEGIRSVLMNRRVRTRWFSTALGFLKECDDLPSGITIIDVCLPDLDGLELQRKLKHECHKPLPVIMLSDQCDISDAVGAMREGAVDFFEKPFRRAEMLDAVVRAELMLHSSECRNAERDDAAISGLTDRELEVLRHSAQGQSCKQVAHELGLSIRTVEMHRSHIIRKMNVSNFAAALLTASSAGYLDP